ncbi:MAG TPA: glycogen-binding domain-containing protein [Candidatus Krumholzibacteriaceae bacterium]|nr:glycogen-binding domain-containing protein [Candidatus Krumholzibacteriaceae bacterium]
MYSAEDNLHIKQQVISFIQSGQNPENLPESHILSPLKDIPAFAITSYYLFENDPATLKRFYRQISQLVINRFSSLETDKSGLLFGSAGIDNREGVYLSPYTNSLGNLEVYALMLISSRLGKHADVLEYLLWTYQYSDLITETFYDYNRDSFFPLDKNGYFIRTYSPELLIPLVLNRKLDRTTKKRIINKVLLSRWKNSYGKESSQFLESPFQRALIINLLSLLDFFPGSESCNTLLSSPQNREGADPETPEGKLIKMLQMKRDSRDIFIKDWTVIASMVHLPALLKERSLVDEKRINSIISEVTKVRQSLRCADMSLDSYIETISTINHLLSEMSQISSVLDSGEKLWKVVDESVWDDLSPKLRRVIVKSCRISTEELMRAKADLSEKLSNGGSFEFRVHFPPSPIIKGNRIDFKSTLKSLDKNVDIKRAILQINGNRWKIGKVELTSLKPGGKALTFTESFSLPPSAGPGIVELPLFIDFMTGNKRVEIHKRRSLAIKEGIEITLNYPEGKRLKKGLPLNLILKYNPAYSIQGVLKGTFCAPLDCLPELPAGFRVSKESGITKLPLSITYSDFLPPGKFPFTLNVVIGGKSIARFNDILTNPSNWIHLGPLSDEDRILNNGLRYQDRIGLSHIGRNKELISWNRVPQGAMGNNGEILLQRIYNGNSGSNCLFYTIMKLNDRKEAFFHIDTSNRISLWVNSNKIFSDINPENTVANMKLKAGKNSILIAASWDKSPSHITLEITDKSGRPIAGMENTIEGLTLEYADVDTGTGKNERGYRHSGSPKEILFSLSRKGCSKISVIGSFNSWNPDINPMKQVEDGKWETRIVLSPGKHTYKFLIDNKLRISDPSCVLEEPDGFGKKNSVLLIK